MFFSLRSLGTHSGHPLTLVFPVTSLNFLMHTFLYISLQYACSRGFVEVGHLQDMRSINPIIVAPTHDMFTATGKFKNRDLFRMSVLAKCKTTIGTRPTLLYVAEYILFAE